MGSTAATGSTDREVENAHSELPAAVHHSSAFPSPSLKRSPTLRRARASTFDDLSLNQFEASGNQYGLPHNLRKTHYKKGANHENRDDRGSFKPIASTDRAHKVDDREMKRRQPNDKV